MRPLAVIALAALAGLLMAIATAPARADYDAGRSAAERGDFATALREWEPLAEQGHARAQTDLGYMYASGHGVPNDDARAVQLYRLAAEQALPLAQFNLGYMYMHGRGIERDYAEGLRWYQRAARQGFLAAQFNLGVRYYTGEGAERDLGEAYFWFALAERGGHARSQRTREGVETLLSEEERVAASERLKSWKPTESRIVGVQTGAHPEFDRVVLQLDRPTEVTRPPVEPGELEVIVAAIPAQEQQVVGREGTRLGRVVLRRDSRGTRVSLLPGERVIRVFTLPEPPRVVIDLGVAGQSPFAAPRDGTPVHPTPGPPEPAPALAPTPEPDPTPAPTATKKPPRPFPEPVVVEPAPLPQPEPAPEPAPAVPPEPAPEIEPVVEPQPAVQPEPVVEPEPATAPEPPTRPVAEPAPAPVVVPPRAEAEEGLPILWIALAGVLLAVGLVLGLWLRQRGRRLAGVPGMETASLRGSPESISPEEIALSGDRVELLEKRLDDEVRARMQLEERLAQVSEEQKVLRDRLRRAARRRDNPC